MQKNLWKYLPLAGGVMFSACGEQQQEEQDKGPPNVVLILADDLGWSQIGCYGSDFYETPHIDKLASQGMQFTDAYAAAAISSPTRASLMTGKYPAQVNLTDYIPGNTFPNTQLNAPDWQQFLPLEEKTVAEAFDQENYATATYGKWHLSSHKKPPESLPYNPDKQGFDDHFVTYKPWPPEDFDPAKDAHNVDSITDAGLEFLETHKDTSFFLLFSHNTIHDPLLEDSALVAKYKQKPGAKQPENHPVVGAMIETLDKSVGRVMEKINTLGLRQNTVFIFYSDNGGKAAYAKQKPLRKGKGWLYEGGIRVPLIIRWPGVVEPGSQSSELVSSIDLYPTWLDIIQSDQSCACDGISLLPVLKQTGTLNRETLYWHYPHYHRGSGMVPAGAIRKGKFKLIEWYEPFMAGEKGAVELYNLQEDIGEQHNLAQKRPEKVKELQKALHEWRKEVNAQMPEENPGYAPKEVPERFQKVPYAQ